MKIISVLFSILIFANSFAQDNQEFRSTWTITWEHINRFQNASQNKARVREILDNHKKANMNAVIWQARQGGTAYYYSSYEPWGYYAGSTNPGYDPLGYAVEEAHKRGLELHAWVNVFHVSSTVAGTIASEHPEWICTNEDAESMTSYRCASPGIEAVRQYTINVIMEIVRNYDIDGIHLDYIRWNEYDEDDMKNAPSQLEQISLLDGDFITQKIIEGASPEGYKRYIYDTEHPASGGVPAGFSNWDDWRRWTVTEFVQVLHDSIQSVKPWVRLTPAALGKHRAGGVNGWNGYYVVFQDAALWFNQGYIDQLTPMHYHWLTGSEFVSTINSDWKPYIQPGIDAGRLYSIGPPSYRLHENNLFYRHSEIVNTCRTLDWTDGFQFFSYGSWAENDYWEVAGMDFFADKSKIRPLYTATPPNAPTISINKVDSLNYDITVTPADILNESSWFIIYRAEDENYDPAQVKIIDLIFSDSSFVHREDFSDAFLFTGTYKYFVTEADRFWNESTISNVVESDSVSFSVPAPALPQFVGVTNFDASSLTIECKVTDFAETYLAYVSTDGVNFNDSAMSNTNIITVAGLTENQVYYFKVGAKNIRGSSPVSEKIFAGVPSSTEHNVLIVNGFDRSTNTRFDYVRFYADPVNDNGYPFSYCLNESIINDNVSLNDFETVIWILGDESTADETFNSAEQTRVKSFLQNGGKLFVSGAEIGWDLGRSGSSSAADVSFYNNYLKAAYLRDAPTDSAGIYYTVEPVSGGVFSGIPQFNFDDGTHGTIDVDWPDAISATGGASMQMIYTGVPVNFDNIAAVSFKGMFDGGSSSGSVIYLAFPFETIYPADIRMQVMEEALNYFYTPITNIIDNDVSTPSSYQLAQNFPNPFNPSTTIEYKIPESGHVKLNVYDILGKEVAVLVDEIKTAGSYSIVFNANKLASGTYIYRLNTGSKTLSKKLVLLK